MNRYPLSISIQIMIEWIQPDFSDSLAAFELALKGRQRPY